MEQFQTIPNLGQVVVGDRGVSLSSGTWSPLELWMTPDPNLLPTALCEGLCDWHLNLNEKGLAWKA